MISRKLTGAHRGGQQNHERRIQQIAHIQDAAKQEAKVLLKRGEALWLIGTALYWAEGSKVKEWNKSEPVSLTNMDPNMIVLIRRWLERYCSVEESIPVTAFTSTPLLILRPPRGFGQTGLRFVTPDCVRI